MGTVGKIIVVGCCFIALFYAVLFVSIDAHERAHVAIFKAGGCEEAVYETTHMGLVGETRCEKYTAKEITKMEELHLLNEIIGYNMDGISLSIVAGFFLLSFAILLNGDKSREEKWKRIER